MNQHKSAYTLFSPIHPGELTSSMITFDFRKAQRRNKLDK